MSGFKAGSGWNSILLKEGDTLFQQGDKATSIYLVQAGSIDLYLEKEDKKAFIGSVKKNQLLGEMAFFGQSPRSLTAIAHEESFLMEISMSSYIGYMDTQPDWLRLLIKSLMGHLRSANEEIFNLQSKS